MPTEVKTQFATFVLAAAAMLFTGCGKKESEPENSATAPAIRAQVEEIAKLYPAANSTDSGLHFVVEKEGDGPTPRNGQMVTAHYHGTLANGEVFDSSIERGAPFSFMVGTGRVIKGWDEAFLSMKKGEKRKIILPSHLAYGSRGRPPVIPPNSILTFEVELLDFK